jgi:hypothetical protein
MTVDRRVGASAPSVAFGFALGSNAGNLFFEDAMSGSRNRGDQDDTRVEGAHDGVGNARRLVRALVSQWHDNMRHARRDTAEGI